MVQICSSNSCAIVTLTGTLSALCHSSPVLYFSPACLTQVTAVGIDVCSLSSQKCKPTACPFCSRTLLARERDPHSITASLDQPSHQHFSPVLTWGFREGKILGFLQQNVDLLKLCQYFYAGFIFQDHFLISRQKLGLIMTTARRYWSTDVVNWRI